MKRRRPAHNRIAFRKFTRNEEVTLMKNMEDLRPAFLDSAQLKQLQDTEKALNQQAAKSEIYLLAVTRERG